MRRLIRALAVGLALGIILGAQPAWANHGNDSPPDNRDVQEYRSTSKGDFVTQAANGNTTMNHCDVQIGNYAGDSYARRYSVWLVDRYTGLAIWSDNGNVIYPGDDKLIVIEPGGAVLQSHEPYLRVYVDYQAGQGWYSQGYLNLDFWNHVSGETEQNWPLGFHSQVDWPGC